MKKLVILFAIFGAIFSTTALADIHQGPAVTEHSFAIKGNLDNIKELFTPEPITPFYGYLNTWELDTNLENVKIYICEHFHSPGGIVQWSVLARQTEYLPFPDQMHWYDITSFKPIENSYKTNFSSIKPKKAEKVIINGIVFTLAEKHLTQEEIPEVPIDVHWWDDYIGFAMMTVTRLNM